jgi:hypothetical protein
VYTLLVVGPRGADAGLDQESDGFVYELDCRNPSQERDPADPRGFGKKTVYKKTLFPYDEGIKQWMKHVETHGTAPDSTCDNWRGGSDAKRLVLKPDMKLSEYMSLYAHTSYLQQIRYNQLVDRHYNDFRHNIVSDLSEGKNTTVVAWDFDQTDFSETSGIKSSSLWVDGTSPRLSWYQGIAKAVEARFLENDSAEVSIKVLSLLGEVDPTAFLPDKYVHWQMSVKSVDGVQMAEAEQAEASRVATLKTKELRAKRQALLDENEQIQRQLDENSKRIKKSNDIEPPSNVVNSEMICYANGVCCI